MGTFVLFFVLALVFFLLNHFLSISKPLNYFFTGVAFFSFLISVYYLFTSINQIFKLKNKYKGEYLFQNTISQLSNEYYALFDLDLKVNYIKHHLDCLLISPSKLYNIKVIYEPGIIKTDKNKNFIFINKSENSAKIIEYKTRFWSEKESLEMLTGRDDFEVVDIVVYLKADRVFKDKRPYKIVENEELINLIKESEEGAMFSKKEQQRLANILLNSDGNNYQYYT